MRKIIIVRHGQTDWNVENRFQGHTDIPLNDAGQAQVEKSALVLASLRPNRLVTSDLLRARETAAAIAKRCGLPVTIDPDLRETYGADWEGKTGLEIRKNSDAEFTAWLSGEDIPAGGSGERRSEVAARAISAIYRGLSEIESGQSLVIVTHGGAARSVIGTLMGLPVSEWASLGGLANASWS
ncbi:MAG: histidine phosphatase family protein, partial [Actinobacteria bacterium]|nr:histidine phosphatase family protein [Actinomycetota bacterium]